MSTDFLLAIGFVVTIAVVYAVLWVAAGEWGKR